MDLSHVIRNAEAGRLAPVRDKGVRRAARRMPADESALALPTTLDRSETAVARRAVSPRGVKSASPALPPSPPPSASFQALLDSGATYSYMPNIGAAVGSNHLMVALMTDIRIQDRQGGAVSTVLLDSFWAGITSPNPVVYDPRLVYDPYGQRWIFVAIANYTDNPGLLLAVSLTSDPTGNWNRRFIDTDAEAPFYALAPTVGFNKDRIIISANVYQISDDLHAGAYIYAFTKSELYAGGSGSPRRFTLPLAAQVVPENLPVPAATYDTTTATNYFLANYNGNAEGYGFHRTYGLGGPLGAEFFVTIQENPDPIYPGWEHDPGTPAFLPQLGSTSKLAAGDCRIQNVVFRDGALLGVQTLFVPIGAPVASSVQWLEMTPGGTILKIGLVDNVSGTLFHAYPSIAANENGDLLVGYSRFSASEYPSAYYSFVSRRDLTGAFEPMRPEARLKAGEASYAKTYSDGTIYWGQWSAAAVDPLNDTDLWTVQPYAATPAGTTNRWGTWWGRVSPPVDLKLTLSESIDPVILSSNLTYTLIVSNDYGGSVTGVQITNILPAGVNFVSASASQGTCTHSSGVVRCNLGTLAAGARATNLIVVSPVALGQIMNSASVGAAGPEENVTNNTATITTTVVPSSDLALLVPFVTALTNSGADFASIFTITNLGPASATGVSFTNTVVGNVNFVSVQSSQGSCGATGNTVFCTLASLPNGGAFTITLVQNAPAGGIQVTNRVRVRSTSADINIANNNSNVVTRINALPVVSLPGNQTINEDTVAGPLPFTVIDAETPADSLYLLARSSNTDLLPSANITLGGSGTNRTLLMTPMPQAFGVSTVSLSVTDGNGTTVTNSFLLTVNPVNDPPTLRAITNVVMNEDSGSRIVDLTGISAGAANESQTLSVTATSSVPSLIANPVPVTYTSPGLNGTLTLQPLTNASGIAFITVMVNDGGASNNTFARTFTVTVNPVNDPPTLDSVANVTLSEDSGLRAVSLTGITAGAPGESDSLSLSVSNSNPGLLTNLAVTYTSPANTGTLSFGTRSNEFGSAVITVIVSDGQPTSGSFSRSFTVTVNPVNDPPRFATIPDLAINEDTGLQTVSLASIRSGQTNESDSLSLSVSNSNPSLLTNIAINYTSPDANGTLTFKPIANAVGTAIITVTLNDNQPENNLFSRSFTVTVNAVNDPPTINPIPDVTVSEDAGLLTVPLSGIIGGPGESDVLSVSVTNSNPGLLTNFSVSYTSPNPTGTLTFGTRSNAFGSATIRVIVNDNRGSNNIVTNIFVVAVIAANDPPTLDPVPDLTINEDSGQQTVTLTGITTGAPNESQLLTLSVSNGNPALINGLSPSYTSPSTSGILTFGTASNGFGSGVITVRVSDGSTSNNLVTRTFTVTVNPVNDRPTLASINDVEFDEDAGPQTVVLTDISSGATNEFQTLTLTATSSVPSLIASPVSVTYTSPNPTGSLTLTPLTNVSGTAIVSVVVRDTGVTNNLRTRSFTIVVNPVNDPPVFLDLPAFATTNEDARARIAFTVADIDSPVTNLTFEGLSSNEELVVADGITFAGSGSNRVVRVQPLPEQSGFVTIFVTATDELGASSTASFELEVTPVNDPPVISAIASQSTREDTPTTAIAFTVDDVDLSPDDLTLTVRSSNPAVVPDAGILFGGAGTARTLTVRPATNQSGSATITVTVDDGETNASSAFVLTVNAVNDPPALAPLNDVTIEEDAGQQSIALTGISAGASDEAEAVSLSVSNSNPSLLTNFSHAYTNPAATGSINFTPVANAFGSAVITVSLSDGQASNNVTVRSFTVTVAPVNDPPRLAAISDRVLNEDAGLQTVSLSGIQSGNANEIDMLSLSVSNSNPALLSNFALPYVSPATNATLTFGTVSNVFGSAVVTVTVNDNRGSNNVFNRSFTVTVNPVNDPPALDPLTDLSIAEDAGQQSVALTGLGMGASNEGQTLTLSATSSDLSIIPAPSVVYTNLASTGTLLFTPLPDAKGTVTLTVTARDGGTSNNITSRSFAVTVLSVNDAPTLNPIGDLTLPLNAGAQTILLSGLSVGATNESQTLTITAVSSNTTVIANPTVTYTNGANTGTLRFTPAANVAGTSLITVTVQDSGGTANGGQNTTLRTFRVTVGASALTLRITAADSSVSVWWPTNAAGYSLVSRDRLPGTAWTPVPEVPVVVGREFRVTMPTTNTASRFFQLTLGGPPALRITLAAANVSLWWPTNATGYTLVSRGSLSGATWTPVTETRAVVGHEYRVTVPTTNAASRFYQLRNP